MQAYMKSALPFRGVPRPGQKAMFAALLSEHLLPDQAAWHDTVLELWDDAGFREERYAAIALLNHRGYAAYLDPRAMPLVDHLVVTGAWWDYVDVLAIRAIRVVGPLVRAHPAELVPLMLTWSTNDDRPRPAGHLHRTEPAQQGVLPPQGHRLGPARPRLARPAMGPEVRTRARRRAVRAVGSRGAEELWTRVGYWRVA